MKFRRVTAHRGLTGHRHDGPQKTVMHACAERERPDPPNFLGRNGSGRGDQLHQEVQFAKPKASATRRPTGPICGPDLALASQEVHLRFRLRVKGLSHP
jgi:hypothetical protein